MEPHAWGRREPCWAQTGRRGAGLLQNLSESQDQNPLNEQVPAQCGAACVGQKAAGQGSCGRRESGLLQSLSESQDQTLLHEQVPAQSGAACLGQKAAWLGSCGRRESGLNLAGLESLKEVRQGLEAVPQDAGGAFKLFVQIPACLTINVPAQVMAGLEGILRSTTRHMNRTPRVTATEKPPPGTPLRNPLGLQHESLHPARDL